MEITELRPKRRSKKVGVSLNYDRTRRSSSNQETLFTELPSIPNIMISRRRETPNTTKNPKHKEIDPKSFQVSNINRDLLNLAKKELKFDDTILALIGVAIIMISYMENEIFFANGNKSTYLCTYLRVMEMAMALFSVMWIARRYYNVLTIKIVTFEESIYTTLLSSSLAKPMIIEMMINIWFSPPGYDRSFTVSMMGYDMTYSWNSVFAFIILLRMYLCIRLFGHYSFYTKPKAERVCEMNGEQASSLFALKCFMQDASHFGIALVFIIISLYWALLMRLAERNNRIYSNTPDVESRLVTLADNLWLVFVTTTTVGYGDIFPVTHPGRCIAVIACIIGNVYLGMLVVSLRKELEHSKEQHLAYAWITRKEIAEDVKKAAALAIRKAFTLYMLHIKWGGSCVSPIKPNPRVVYKGVEVPNDQAALGDSKYNRKFSLYKEMKASLHHMKVLVKKSREVGETDNDIIMNLADIALVDLYDIEGKLKSVINESRLLEASSSIGVQRQIENKTAAIRDMSRLIRRRLVGNRRGTVSPDMSPKRIVDDYFSVAANDFSIKLEKQENQENQN
ncbi:unnamed protein product [Blepharisma stoltei]|uniref:Potassium channel domain-containing protein n=1 Tax=Blepharisma stoltei TaxID=1481888 RepID=A0AAU9IUI3_9CILI|nr:unnamed protein product [Blepharisma stoltei]